MAPFRWPKVDQDIALCKGIIAQRPRKPDDWEDIAEFLSNLFTTENNPVQLKGGDAVSRVRCWLRNISQKSGKP